jgi:hypothetical protein
MLNWFRRKPPPEPPVVRRQLAGELHVSSGTVMIGDPTYMPDLLWLENVPIGDHAVTATTLSYPNGVRRIAGIEMSFQDNVTGTPKELGEFGVDSASVVVLDLKTQEDHWKEVGDVRIGMIGTPEHLVIAKLLRSRFGLESEPISSFQSRVRNPVSTELETEILAYLKTIPEYAQYPFMYFRVDTNNTLDQVTEQLGLEWCMGELVLDEPSQANVLAFSSGFGDGTYDVIGIHHNGQLAKASVEFIGPEQEKVLEAFPILRC